MAFDDLNKTEKSFVQPSLINCISEIVSEIIFFRLNKHLTFE